MKVWLDDMRPAPPGWIHIKTVNETIELLKTGKVIELALDNDLGKGPDGQLLPEGFKVIDWMEENNIWPPNRPTFHSSNWSRRESMWKVLNKHYGWSPKK